MDSKPLKILYFNYEEREMGVMLRSYELARAMAEEGAEVLLQFNSKILSPAPAFKEHVERTAPKQLAVRYRKTAVAPELDPSKKMHSSHSKLLTKFGSVVMFLRYATRLQLVPSEFRLIRSFRPDVVVARHDSPSPSLASFLTRVPLIIEGDGPLEEVEVYHGIPLTWFKPYFYRHLKKAKFVTSISRVLDDIYMKYGITHPQLIPSHNGADPEFFKPYPEEDRQAIRRKFGLEDKVVIGFAGDARLWYGIGDAVKELIPVMRENPDIALLMMGKLGQMVDAINAETNGAMSDRIVSTGTVPFQEMPLYMSALDIVILPYLGASALFHFSPIKLFESMAAGRAVVAARLGQMAEIIRDGENGVLFEPEDATDMLRAVDRLVKSKELRDSVGRAARRTLEEKYTWRHSGRRLYEACLVAAGRAEPHEWEWPDPAVTTAGGKF